MDTICLILSDANGLCEFIAEQSLFIYLFECKVIWVKQQEFSFCVPLDIGSTLDIVRLSHCDAKGTETNIFK